METEERDGTRPLRHQAPATRKQERARQQTSDRGRLPVRIVGGFSSSLFLFLFFFSLARGVGGSDWGESDGWIRVATAAVAGGWEGRRERALISAAASCRYFRVVRRDKNIFAGRLSFVRPTLPERRRGHRRRRG